MSASDSAALAADSEEPSDGFQPVNKNSDNAAGDGNDQAVDDTAVDHTAPIDPDLPPSPSPPPGEKDQPPSPGTSTGVSQQLDQPPEQPPPPKENSLTDEERIELELTSSCALMFQCAWRQRVAVQLATSIAKEVIEKIYDPRTETYYYYNKRLDKSRWEIPKYFQLARGGEKILTVSPTYTEPQAATMIESAIRRRLGRKNVRNILVKHTDKVYDEGTNSYYYYYRVTGETRWEKPGLWGEEDVEDYDGKFWRGLREGRSEDG